MVVGGLLPTNTVLYKLGYEEYSGSVQSITMSIYYPNINNQAHMKAIGGILIVEYSIANDEWQSARQGRLMFYTKDWKSIGVVEEGNGMSYNIIFDSDDANRATITLTPKYTTLVYLRYKGAYNVVINP